MFSLGNIWGVLAVVGTFAIIVLLQRAYEKGHKIARLLQYLVGLLFIIYAVVILINLQS